MKEKLILSLGFETYLKDINITAVMLRQVFIKICKTCSKVIKANK